jgi:DNA polymerase III subunit delta'
MPFSTLIGNDRIKTLLRRALTEKRIGQSLLMAGPRGVGKHSFAVALAQALNCQRVELGEPCGDCIPCRKIARGEHADVRTILRESQDPAVKKESKSQFIKIEQTRALAEQAQFRPYEGSRRVFIIDEAEWLRHEAANSLLKTLEEPPDTSLLILITAKPFALLDTIRSRCLLLSFAPLSAIEIESHLRTKTTAAADEAKLRARLAHGSIGRAIDLNLAEYREMRTTLLDLIETLAFSRDSIRLMNAAEYLGRKLDKDAFERHLDALTILLNDLFYLKLGRPNDSLINEDIIDRLERISEVLAIEQIIEWSNRIEELFFNMPRNVNRQLAMENILIAS